jgi:hypothetical protein
MAAFKGGKKMYPATVMAVNLDGTYRLLVR